MRILWKEPIPIEQRHEQLRRRGDAHLLLVLELVVLHLPPHMSHYIEGVGAEADGGENEGVVAAEAPHFFFGARVDVVALRVTGVAGEDDEVGAGDAEDSAAVVGVPEGGQWVGFGGWGGRRTD